MRYQYVVAGIDGNENSFRVTGEVASEGMLNAWTSVQKAAFQQLTDGKAVYGRPGRGGCRGPYRFTDIRVNQARGNNLKPAMHYMTALEEAIIMLDAITHGKQWAVKEYMEKLDAIREAYAQANEP